MAKFRYLLILLSAVLITSCSTVKYLAPGQKLYDGGEVKIADKNNTKKSEAKALTTELTALLRPAPNAKILGLRYKLWIYDKTRTNKRRGLKHWLNTSLGEPPVLVSSVDVAKNGSILQNRLQNEGYFLAQVSGDTVSKKQIAKAIYTVQTGPAYHYNQVTFPTDNDDLDTAVTGTSKQTLLKVGDKFNLDVIKAERIRIDARLKEEGFFYFAPEDLIMKYDSTVADHKINMFVKVKETTPDEARWIYSVRNIYVYPNYSLRDTSLKLDSAVKYRWYNIIDPKKKFRPYTFTNTVLLHPGDIYNRTQHTNSLARFVQLGPFKFVKNRFEDVTPDSAKLDIYYFLTQQKRKSIQAGITLRQTSANYSGTEVDINLKNRNTFKGAELFNIRLFGSSDVQFGSYNNGYNVYQVGIEPSIVWPRFVGPLSFNNNNAFIPHTALTTGYTLVRREKLYTLNSFNLSFGYDWKPSEHKENQLNLFNLTYVDAASISELYKTNIRESGDPALKHVINNQLTFGPSYSYTYTNTTDNYRTNTIYYNGKLSESASLLGLITGADADTTKGKLRKVFRTPFDQYIKLENEIRFYHKIGPGSTIATRLMVDVGMPFGNSTVLPYSQQFFIGGANSLRGYQAHSIGPGSYLLSQKDKQGTNFLPDESGDIKIEANAEWRPKLFSIVEGALFIEGGNIWLYRSNPSIQGGTFGKNFLSQFATDAGLGLRFNLTVLVLRTDVGFPLTYPNKPAGQHFGQNGVFNLAIGYPF